jgi:ribosomal protein S18 acetylase RimI-like enzyme
MHIDTDTLEIRDLRRDELPAAVELLSLAMRDNPIHVAAYGTDPKRRRHCHRQLMRGLFRVFTAQQPIAAFATGTLVGVTGIAPVGTCQPSVGQRMRLAPSLIGLGPATAARIGKWVGAWAKHDLDEPHVHLGPLGVELELQGKGIGSRILTEHVRRLDTDTAVGYLETDKVENVRLYERYGYVVLAEEPVLGVTNWYMRRSPRG